jgi:predicted permease
MTASGFRITRVPPLLGRYLVDDDEREGAIPVVVIGYDMWRNRFARDPKVVGRTLQLGAELFTVVGVMPEGFAFPVNNRLWTPLRLDPLDYEAGAAPPIEVFGRLAPGATLEGAQAQLTAIGQRLSVGYPSVREHLQPTVLPYTYSIIEAPQLVWVFQIIRLLVGMLLVVIAVNVAILVYARTATRAGELAVRLALGASRTRVVAQIFAEALMLSVVSAGIGLLGARFILRQISVLLDRFGGDQVPFWWDFDLAPATVLYVAGLAVIAAAIIGIIPALKVTGHRVQTVLRTQGGGTGMRMGRTWTVLIALQAAVAVTLLPTAAALSLKQLLVNRAAAPSVSLDEIYSAGVVLDPQTPPTAKTEAYDRKLVPQFADRQSELVRRLGAEPGVMGVTFASGMPGGDSHRSIEIEATAPSKARTQFIANSLEIGPGLFDLFGASMLAGRPFQPSDLSAVTGTVIVNRSFVQAAFGGGQVLGRRFQYVDTGSGPGPGGVEAGGWYEIVGVVSDFPNMGEGPEEAAAIYHPATAPRFASATILVRVQDGTSHAFTRRVREITSAVDPALRVTGVSTVAESLRLIKSPDRLIEMALIALMSSVLFLSAAGIHALVSLTVSQRRKEIGIRIALGARSGQVLRNIVSRALRQIALGLGLGGVLGGVMIPAITTTNERAAALIATVAAVILIVGLFAVVGPARQALRVKPMEALREE